MGSPLYILDTSVLIHFVRGDRTWHRIRDEYGLLVIEPKPIISIVTSGELRSLALQLDWGTKKREQLRFALGYFDQLSIDSEKIVDAYANIDHFLHQNGVSLGKNDIWIAASAVFLDAKLLTKDHDFDALDPTFLSRDIIT